ncbi:DNA-processing protein DprA, partial [Patescibacteria group bacterium]|nr:DNA-processing protein DprA [Patescibacteria group bacterium]
CADAMCIAIVGTRLPSRYGLEMAYDISSALAEAGAVIVSGLAFGVDAQAHRAALDLGKPTIAVLASGVDRVTPSSHAGLAENIIAGGGALLSEYECFDSAHRYRFLERNRIISGLCKATIVIEAKEKSGALITARHAFDQGRDVYALVGDITRLQARGVLSLIKKDMARPIVSLEGLMEDLGLDRRAAQMELLNDKETEVLGLLETGAQRGKGAHFVSDILEKSGLPVHELNAILSMLELRALVRKLPDGRFEIIR